MLFNVDAVSLVYLAIQHVCMVCIDMVEEGKALADKPHIVISTPGRLADHINTGTNFSLKKLRFLVTLSHSICTYILLLLQLSNTFSFIYSS